MDEKVSIEKLNEFFANALALELVGRTEFLLLLLRGGQSVEKAGKLADIYEGFLKNYAKKLGVKR